MSVRGARWTLRNRLAEHRIYLPIARRKYGDAVLSPDTQLVIDGFTRSGVTFAVFAFQLAQRRPVRVAHHLHASSHLIAAARRGVPALLVIRGPEAAVLSAMIREPHVTAAAALRAYTRFHQRLWPFRQSLVVGEFDRVTADFGQVIDDLNRRYGTTFEAFRHTADNVSCVFRLIEDRSRRPPWRTALGRLENGRIGLAEYEGAVAAAGGRERLSAAVETRIARPSAEREAMKERLRGRVASESALLAEARDAFAALVGSTR